MYIYIYIYIYIHHLNECPTDVRQKGGDHTGVCETSTPPEEKTHGKMGFWSAKSGAGEQLSLLCYMAKARAKGVFFFADTGRNRLETLGQMTSFFRAKRIASTRKQEIEGGQGHGQRVSWAHKEYT